MCDLIDLKSPDGKTISGTKLASPLIPAPAQTLKNDKNDSPAASNSNGGLNFEKRNSLDNNPFDNAHHKIVDYALKQEDPFEVALEKALTYEERRLKSSASKVARSDEFKDDFTPKKKRYSDILKMNKTLDDSLTDLRLNKIKQSKKIQSSPVAQTNVIKETRESHCSNEAKLSLPICLTTPQICVESTTFDTSILNQSAMNDSLTESSGSVDENLLKSVLGLRINERIRGGTKDPDFIVAADEIPKLQRQRRSLSQGDKMSPRKFRQHRSRSIVDFPRIVSDGEDNNFVFSVPSIVCENNTMNTAFVLPKSFDNASVLSNISNISSITRPISVSSSNSSFALSNCTLNRAFVESYESNEISANYGNTENDKIVHNTRLRSNDSAMSKNSVDLTRDESDLNDLILKYSKIREKTSETPKKKEVSPLLRKTNSESSITNDKSICSNNEDKLIDVDVFVPASSESPENFPRKSVSSTSSDSVFVDSDAIEKSIFSEAKSLARTFEELAFKTGSSSTNSDDLLNSRPNWNFDILPLSDDEVLVDNLIELQKSPGKSDTETANDREESQKSTSSSDAKSERSMIKELETKFRDPEKKIIASTLLLDLEKLVKSENNSEAAELLKSLEKALGIKFESNVDLLSTCLSTRNDLTKSPKRNDNCEGQENINDNNIEKSSEDNNDVETSESFQQLSLSDDKSLHNNLNNDKEINTSVTSSIIVNEKNNDSSMENSHENVSKDLSDKIHEDSIDVMKQHNQITDDQKIAVEILVGLGKLLTSENKDPMTSTLLKNLGIALNLASSNNCDNDDDFRSSFKETRRFGTPVKNRVATPPRKSSPLVPFSKTANRRSLELSVKAKTTVERVLRRSNSITHTTASTNPNVPRLSNTPLSVDKSKAHLNEGKKRFSSDPSSDIQLVNGRKLNKDIAIKPVAVSELARQEKPSSTVIVGGSVKNRLRKKAEPDVAGKKGPMKAIIPLGNMQRRGSFVKKESGLNGSITPPKPGREISSSTKVTTSTPFPIVNFGVSSKKSLKSKPIASSTPDDVGTKNARRSISQIPQSPGRNALSCNISPVTPKTSKIDDDNSSHNNSTSSRTGKICTPSKSRQSSQLPKLSPMHGTKISSPKSNRGQRRSEPLQSLLPRSFGTPRSPSERPVNDGSTSPLNSSKQLGSTVKPLNLISKLGRRNSASVAEKENYV